MYRTQGSHTPSRLPISHRSLRFCFQLEQLCQSLAVPRAVRPTPTLTMTACTSKHAHGPTPTCTAAVLACPLLLLPWPLQPLGRAVIFQNAKGLDKKAKLAREERLRKWNESFWKMFVFLLFSTIAVAVSYGEQWFTDTR